MSRNYLEAFVIIIVAGALGFFLVWPKYEELKSIESKIEEKNAEVKTRQDYYTNLGAAVSELEQYSDNLKKIDSAFPASPDAPAFMNFVQAAAMQSGLIIKSIDYAGQKIAQANPAGGQTRKEAAPTLKNSLQSYGVNVELTGNYASFKNFLSRLEHTSRLVEVDSIIVSAGEDADSRGGAQEQKKAKPKASELILDYTIKLSANYYQRLSTNNK